MYKKHIHKKSPLSQAIALAIASGALGVAGSALGQEGSARTLEEVIVTATKRAENMQDIPVTVQQLGEETLRNRDVLAFSDYVKQLPNVSFAGRGPGQNDVFIRGVSVGRGSLFQAGGIGAGPTVATYVDDNPITAAGRNLDIYLTDLERIEVLPGPQGTLYGSSSQAGTIRLVTNKPDASAFDFGIDTSGSGMGEGEGSYGFEGFVNIPIIKDRLAVRVAAYSVEQGGYIDNVPGTISFEESSRIINTDDPDAVFGVADNEDQVKDDINNTNYTGARIKIDFSINDNWRLEAGFITQDLEADGVFDMDPTLGDLQVQRFNRDRLDDNFDQFNWLLEGHVGEWLEVVYSGSYLERDVEQHIDYVGYTLDGGFQPFYNCTYDFGDFSTLQFAINECAPPDQNFHGIGHSEDTQHELRFFIDPGGPLQFMGGIWYENSDSGASQMWRYHSPELAGIAFAPNAPHSEANAFFDPSTRDPEVAFFNDLVRASEQLAFFGEVTWEFLDNWSVTGGLRYFDIDQKIDGSFNFASFGLVDTDAGGTLNDIEPESESDTIFKATLSYTPNEDILLYGTFSEGFRRGGFNRQGDVLDRNTGEFLFPAFFQSDTINNWELGWKTVLLGNRLRFNGTVYYIDWNGVQIDIFDQSINQLLFTANSAKAEIIGSDLDFTFMVTDNLTLSGAFSINGTELSHRPEGANNLVPSGSDLPLVPTFQGNLNARYEFDMAGMRPFAQLNIQRAGSTDTSSVVDENFPLNDWTTLDLSFGVNNLQLSNLVGGKGSLDVKVFLNNLTDKRAQLFISNQDDIPRTVVNRPRTFGVKVSYGFN